MTSSRERMFVDVRDLFGTREHLNEKDEAPKISPFDEDNTLKPQLRKSANSDIFFAANSAFDDISNKRFDTRSKGCAPKPPAFLVDCDVSLSEQHLNGDGGHSDDAGSALSCARSSSGMDTDDGDSGCNSPDRVAHGRKRVSAGIPSAPTRRPCTPGPIKRPVEKGPVQRAVEKGGRPSGGIPSPPPRRQLSTKMKDTLSVNCDTQSVISEASSLSPAIPRPPSHSPSIASRASAQSDRTSKPNETIPSAPPAPTPPKITSTPSHPPSVPRPPAFPSATPQRTSISSPPPTPNRTSIAKTAAPPLPPPPGLSAPDLYPSPKETSPWSPSSISHSAARYSENDDGFEEGEMTLNFDDEIDDCDNARVSVEQQNTKRVLYKEYKGEDYSSYLEDDQNTKPKSKRKLKKNSKGDKQIPANGDHSLSSNETPAKMKLKVGDMWRYTGESSGHELTFLNSNIHNFSYTDSKIGNDGEDDVSDSSSLPSGRFEKNTSSTSHGRNAHRWWNKDTLSAHSGLSSHSDVLLKRRTKSVTNLVDSVDNDSISAFSEPAGGKHIQLPNKYADFESYRKNIIYATKDKKTGSMNKLWSKLRTLRKGEPVYDYSSNATSNPLSHMAAEVSVYE